MTTAIQASSKPEIEYPDDDGELTCDGTLQFEWIARIKNNLDHVFRNEPNVFVAGNLLWYAVEGQPTIRTTPDVMVAFGRPIGRRGSYKQWEEGNIPPQVVFETFSTDTCPVGLENKFRFYQLHGVEEYYSFNPDDGSFEAWLRRGSHLEKVKDVFGFVSPRLRIRFEPAEGENNLKIFGPNCRLFQTMAEVAADLDAARKRLESAVQIAEAGRERAEAERERAEARCERAEAERERADRLAAQLRALGIDPDSI